MQRGTPLLSWRQQLFGSLLQLLPDGRFSASQQLFAVDALHVEVLSILQMMPGSLQPPPELQRPN
jgi:hypothetical protein